MDGINLLDKKEYYQNVLFYSMLDEQGAEELRQMNIEKKIMQELGIEEFKLTYNKAQRTYRFRTNATGKKMGLKSDYYGSDKVKILENIYKDIKRYKDTTLRDIYKLWHNARLNDPDISITTNRHDEQYWKKYFENSTLCDMPIDKIDQKLLFEHFKNMTAGRKMTRKGFTNVKSMMNLIFDYACGELGLLSVNVCKLIKPNSFKFKPTRKRNLVYTLDERKRILEYLHDSNNIYDLAIYLTFFLGCRISETKALHWEDIDFIQQTVFIHREIITNGVSQNQQIEVDRTKSGEDEGNREVTLVPEAMNVLQKIRKINPDPVYLFLGKNKGFLLTQEFNKHLRIVCNALNINYYPSHKIRATIATEAVRAGMDEVTAMYTFGWKTRETMQTYIRAGRTKANQQASFYRFM